MTLINLSGIHSEAYRELTDGETPAAEEAILLPLGQLQQDSSSIFELTSAIGVIIDTETPFSELETVVDKISFVDIRFPVFGDGRGFSLAVRLRKDYGFKGEIRASGHVLPDQALFLLRAGFDSVDAPEERREAFEAALKRFGAFYQTDMIGHGKSVAHLRHAASDTASDTANDTGDEETKTGTDTRQVL
jgi:uncharacterized protein (DUF934 family)